MARPEEFPDWATNTNHTVGLNVGTPNKIALTTETTEGSVNGLGYAPDARKYNKWQNLVGQWIRYVAASLIEITDREVKTPHDFLNGANAATVQAAGGWRPYIIAMLAHAATTGVGAFQHNYTYNVLGAGTEGTECVVPSNIELQGNSAYLKRVGGGVNENILDFTSAKNVIVSYLSVDGNHLGNGASGALGSCVHISGTSEDIFWVGGEIKNYSVPVLTGAAGGIVWHDAPKRLLFKRIKFSQANPYTGPNGTVGAGGLMTAGSEDIVFEDCEWDCTNLKAGYSLDGHGCTRFKVKGGRGFYNGGVHAILTGYSLGAKKFDVLFEDFTVFNCAWTGISMQGPLGVGAGNYGVKFKNVVFAYCGGAGASIGTSSIWCGHKTLDLENVTIIENGIDYTTNTARTYAGDPIYRPSTPQDAAELNIDRLKVTLSAAGYSGGIDFNNCDIVRASHVDIDAAYGARFTFGLSGADAPGGRRRVIMNDVQIKGSSPAWYGLEVAAHFGLTPVTVDIDNIVTLGPNSGTATGNPEHSGIHLTKVGAGSIRGRVFGYNRDTQSCGLYLDEPSTEALYQGKLRLDLNIDTCYHGTWLPAVGAGTTWLLLPELNYINCSNEVTFTGTGAARLKRAPSAYGRKVVYSDATPEATAGDFKVGDVCLHSAGTVATCTTAGNAGDWSSYV